MATPVGQSRPGYNPRLSTRRPSAPRPPVVTPPPGTPPMGRYAPPEGLPVQPPATTMPTPASPPPSPWSTLGGGGGQLGGQYGLGRFGPGNTVVEQRPAGFTGPLGSPMPGASRDPYALMTSSGSAPIVDGPAGPIYGDPGPGTTGLTPVGGGMGPVGGLTNQNPQDVYNFWTPERMAGAIAPSMGSYDPNWNTYGGIATPGVEGGGSVGSPPVNFAQLMGGGGSVGGRPIYGYGGGPEQRPTGFEGLLGTPSMGAFDSGLGGDTGGMGGGLSPIGSGLGPIGSSMGPLGGNTPYENSVTQGGFGTNMGSQFGTWGGNDGGFGGALKSQNQAK